MPQSIKKRRNLYYAGAILLVGFLFSYYFFVLIPERERQMNERGVRIMNRMVRNLGEREDHYKKSFSMFKCNFLLKGALSDYRNQADLINTLDLIKKANCFEIDDNIKKIKEELESLNQKKPNLVSIYSVTQYLKELNNQPSENKQYSKLKELTDRFEQSLNLDPRVNFIQINTPEDAEEFSKTNALKRFLGNNDQVSAQFNSDSSKYAIGVSAEGLLQDVKFYEFYDDIVLTDSTGSVIGGSLSGIEYFHYQPEGKTGTDQTTEEVTQAISGKAFDEIKFDTGTGLYQIPNVDRVAHEIGGEVYECFTTLAKIDGKKYYLTGLITKDKYNSKVRSVSIWVLMVTLLLLIFLIQVLPVLKPFLLSKKERLQSADVVWSAISVVFGTAVLTLLIIGVDTFTIEEKALVDKKLSDYAANINANFSQQLRHAVNEIKSVNTFYSQCEVKNDASKVAEDNTDMRYNRNVSPGARYLRISDNGKAVFYKIENQKPAIINQSIDLSHRGYYKAMFGKDGQKKWNYNFIPGGYIVESLFSLSEGAYETVIAIPPDAKNLAYAMVYRMPNINELYLEPGYQFSVIDKSGTIMYHTDQSKIKNENFLAETDKNDKLISYLNNASSGPLELQFSLKDLECHVQPIANTPWFVITQYDIRKSRLNITQSLATTFSIVLFLLLYLLLLHMVVYAQKQLLRGSRKSKFQYIFISPINASPRVFVALTALNVLIGAMLILQFHVNALNLILNIVMFLGIITIAILISYVILTRYTLTASISTFNQQKRKVDLFEWVLLLFWLLWFISTVQQGSLIWVSYLLLALQVALLALYVYLKIGTPLQAFLSSTNRKNSYVPFYMHTFSWVCLLGVLSAFMFFKPVYNQMHIKRAISNWAEEYEYRKANGKTEDNKQLLFKPSANGSEPDTLNRESISGNFVDAITVYFEEDAQRLVGQTKSKGLNYTIHEGIQKETELPFFEVEISKKTREENDITIKSNTVVAFSLPSINHVNQPIKAMGFWLLILLLLAGLFTTIKGLSQKYFYLNLLNQLRAIGVLPKTSALTKENPNDAIVHDNQLNIMLVGPPYSGRNALATKLTGESDKRKYLDFINDLDSEKIKLTDDFLKCPIIINNFDYRIFDFEHNAGKLDVLEQILRFRNENQINSRLILISSFGTNQLINIYNDEIIRLRSLKTSDSAKISELVKDVYRWESLLFGFAKYLIPLSHKPSTDFVSNELGFGTALLNLEPQIAAYHAGLQKRSKTLSDEEIHDQLIDAIVDMAQNYYFAIWNACSKEEKFLIYDMAEDGLINSKNTTVLNELVRKGIILTDPSLRLFNESFAKFVLENIKEDEGAIMEREAKKEGVWGMYRFLVIFLIIGILLFLSFVEQEAIAKITGIISVSTLIFPKIIDAVGKISSSKGLFTKSS